MDNRELAARLEAVERENRHLSRRLLLPRGDPDREDVLGGRVVLEGEGVVALLELALAGPVVVALEAELVREQAQELPERDPLDYVREAEEAEAQERYERYAEDNFTDAEADADTLASAGMGTDEDYGMFDSGDEF